MHCLQPNCLTDGINGDLKLFAMFLVAIIAAIPLTVLSIYLIKSGIQQERERKEMEEEEDQTRKVQTVSFDPDNPDTWKHFLPLLILPAGDPSWAVIALVLFLLAILILAIFRDEIAAILNDIFGRR